MIDLHAHTKASDGDLSFEQLLSEAKKAGLNAVAITDHDTTESAMKITGNEDVELIAGVELSVFDHEMNYTDVHVLGLLIDPKHPSILSKFDVLKKQRTEQKKEIISKLSALGYQITFEEVNATVTGTMGRPHIARVITKKYPKQFPTVKSVFEKLIAKGKPAYADRKDDLTLKEAVRIIHDSGGLAFLAHPFLYDYDVRRLVSDFKNAGGDGIEVYYDYETNLGRRLVADHDKLLEEVPKSFTNQSIIEKGSLLAKEFGLLQSGGSDFHGPSLNQKLGTFGAPDELLETIKRAKFKSGV